MAVATSEFPIEIEGKYRVDDPIGLLAALSKLGAQEQSVQSHEDHYLRHPSRDFKITDEALRMRRVNDGWFITYKGPRQEGQFKIRPELELPLAVGTEEDWLRIWRNLGFELVAVVFKSRRVFNLSSLYRGMLVTLDDVVGIGTFAEVECVVHSSQELSEAEQAIGLAANHLGLSFHERRSYLSMVLEQQK